MKQPTPPAQLWIGAQENLHDDLIVYLQKKLCQKSTCGTCTNCQSIRQQQHHSILWLSPENLYAVKNLEPIFHTLTFARTADDPFFFIIDKADCLNLAGSNKLLKPIEEPPIGYHFVFLASRKEHILPTIQSRCITKIFYDESTRIPHQTLYNYFTGTIRQEPSQFLKDLDVSKITATESLELLDSLIAFWGTKYKAAVMNNDDETAQRAKNITDLLTKRLDSPPMPGSSKLFWRDIYLRVNS